MHASFMLLLTLIIACSTFGCNTPDKSTGTNTTAEKLPTAEFSYELTEGATGRAFVPMVELSKPLADSLTLWVYTTNPMNGITANYPMSINAYMPGAAIVCVQVVAKRAIEMLINPVPTEVPQKTRSDLKIRMMGTGNDPNCMIFIAEKMP